MKNKRLSTVFLLLAVLLSDVMCAVVAYLYCDMQWGIQYRCYSAPAWVAFLWAIPYGVGIAVCLLLVAVLRKRERRADV